IVDMLNEKLQRLREIFRGEAQFIVDRDVDMIIVKIKDKETGELIRQIPPEVAVKLARNIAEFMGILLDELA
ncbi:MAG: flagellar biosynthesis protein FlaG, partial [Thermotoga sp.]